jgi:hypothetical protein
MKNINNNNKPRYALYQIIGTYLLGLSIGMAATRWFKINLIGWWSILIMTFCFGWIFYLYGLKKEKKFKKENDSK